MEGILRRMLLTAVAPIAWGTTYYVTHAHLPADAPLYGAVLRALPAGLLLLAVRRRLPHGPWWWKSLVLGVLNMGAFFVLVYVAAQLLPTSIASSVMATSPLSLMLFAWALAGERPGARPLAGAAVGIAGVGLLLLTGVGAVDPVGVLASVAALLSASVGYVLAKRWSGEVDVLASTSWQLIAGGLVLLPAAVLGEGAPPRLDTDSALAFGYVTVVATALAFTAWFAGLARLPASTVGLIGLLNPVTGVLLGVLLAGDTLTGRQLVGLGMVLLGVLAGRPARSGARGRSRDGGPAGADRPAGWRRLGRSSPIHAGKPE
ncbi:EamA family transporter [Streptomyces sp. WAC06614]|uniref:EamA family transporter n=1 Tax=Streptomyces sp. WAC06614 TaxID=2487416 RepID=UPI000F799614|nr:EamA family transporter [Streptomyces sp. WAC06614]RSS82285.1 EamA family transporter [Streptomyces sp. WAC06614]